MRTRAQLTTRALPIALGIGVVLTLFLGVLAVHQVDEGYVGVEKKWGEVTGTTFDPGMHFTRPFAVSVQTVETRPRTYTMADTQDEGDEPGRQDAVVVQTINGTTVRVDVTVRYRVNASEADQFVSEWNDVGQAEQRLIRPAVRSQLRDEAAAIPTSEIYTSEGRQRLAQAAREALVTEFSGEAMILEAVQVREVNLPDDYDRALNEKEIAKQRVEAEENRLEQDRIKAEQRRVQAQAQADVVEIRGEALRENPIVLRARYIQALDNGNVFVVPQDGSTPIIMDASDLNATGGNASSNWTTNATAAGATGD